MIGEVYMCRKCNKLSLEQKGFGYLECPCGYRQYGFLGVTR